MEAKLAELREVGYTVVQGVIPGDALVALLASVRAGNAAMSADRQQLGVEGHRGVGRLPFDASSSEVFEPPAPIPNPICFQAQFARYVAEPKLVPPTLPYPPPPTTTTTVGLRKS